MLAQGASGGAAGDAAAVDAAAGGSATSEEEPALSLAGGSATSDEEPALSLAKSAAGDAPARAAATSVEASRWSCSIISRSRFCSALIARSSHWLAYLRIDVYSSLLLSARERRSDRRGRRGGAHKQEGTHVAFFAEMTTRLPSASSTSASACSPHSS